MVMMVMMVMMMVMVVMAMVVVVMVVMMVMVMVMVLCNPHEDGVLPVDIPWVEKTRIWARSSSPAHLTITMILMIMIAIIIKSRYFKMLI